MLYDKYMHFSHPETPDFQNILGSIPPGPPSGAP